MSKLILIEGEECGYKGKVAIIINNAIGIYKTGEGTTMFVFENSNTSLKVKYEEVLEKIKEQAEK